MPGKMTGTEKDYGCDPAKREVRRRFLGLIGRSFDRQRFDSLRVLCLAGREAWEVNEVYSHLRGFREENLTVVERDPLSARLIRASLPSAHVHAGDVEGFLAATDRTFDVISLDFCGQFGPSVYRSVESIRVRRLLRSRAALLVAVSARMEGRAQKEAIKAALERRVLCNADKAIEAGFRGNMIPMEIVEGSIGLARSDALTEHTVTTLTSIDCGQMCLAIRDSPSPAYRKRISAIAWGKFMSAVMRADPEVEADAVAAVGENPQDAKIRPRKARFSRYEVDLPPATTTDNMEAIISALRAAKIRIVVGDESVKWTAESDGTGGRVVYVSDGMLRLFDEFMWSKIGGDPATDIEVSPVRACLDSAVRHAMRTDANALSRDLVGLGLRSPGPTWLGEILFAYQFGVPGGMHTIDRAERLRYVSDSGCPMIVDMLGVTTAFRGRQVVAPNEDGYMRFAVPASALRSRRSAKSALRELTAEMFRWANAAKSGAKDLYGDEAERVGMHCAREEVVARIDDGACENCRRLEIELGLLKRQLAAMRDEIRQKREERKLKKAVRGVGDYEKLRIYEMLLAGKPDGDVVRELGVTAGQAAACRAWITMRGKDYWLAKIERWRSGAEAGAK